VYQSKEFGTCPKFQSETFVAKYHRKKKLEDYLYLSNVFSIFFLKRFTEHTFANLTYEIVKVLDEKRVEN